jgi:hypothetical protein
MCRVRIVSRLPRRAPELSPGNCPQGRGRKPRVDRGPGMALLATPGESEERRIQAATGRLFFGYFLFDCMDAGGRAPTVGALGDAGAVAEAKQKKVTRFRVRGTRFKQASR